MKYTDFNGNVVDTDEVTTSPFAGGDPEKERRRQRYKDNRKHKQKDLRNLRELGDSYDGSRRIKTSAKGNQYVSEGKTSRERRMEKKAERRARRRELVDFDSFTEQEV